MKLVLGDCIEKLKELPENSVDSIVTDPPYELGFMGKSWDNTGIAYNPELWKQALRVLKPGGHLVSFGGSRTYHRMACAIEDAGFEIRDQIMWVYGSGFPKSLNIGKAIDKMQGNEREEYQKPVAYPDSDCWGTPNKNSEGVSNNASNINTHKEGYSQIGGVKTLTKGYTQWEGWGTALKPSHEPIVLARKPLSEKTVAENVLRWGTGGINIDGCRVAHNEECKMMKAQTDDEVMTGGGKYGQAGRRKDVLELKPNGRFPANFIHDGSEEVLELFPNTKSGGTTTEGATNNWGDNRKPQNYIEASSGSAARFFYCAKASKSERNEGCEGLEEKIKHTQMRGANGTGEKNFVGGFQDQVMKNSHPTVKPIKLMAYLCKLITPKGGIVLDPFMGSGSTGVACKREGFDFIGIEREPEYMKIAEARIK